MGKTRNFWIVLFAYGIGAWFYSAPFVGDQKVYISTAMEMWERGSFLHPYLFGETSYFKPPWLFWTLLAGWKIFGFNLFGTFFFSILATALTALILDLISGELADHQEATQKGPEGDRRPLAGIWFAGGLGTLCFGTTAQMEIWVVFFYSLAWLCFLKHLKSGKLKWLILGLVVSGISGLNKSPLYSVFSVLGYYSYLLAAPQSGNFSSLTTRRSWFRKPSFYLAHGLGIAAGLAWFIAIWMTDKERFWNHYVLQETLGKRGGNSGTAGHMWLDFLGFTVPFSLLLIPAILNVSRKGKAKVVFILCWSLLPAAFFSYFPYRTETYLYILVPALALLLDWGMEGAKDTLSKWAGRVNGILVGISVLAFSIIFATTHLIHFSWIALLGGAGTCFLLASWRVFSATPDRRRIAALGYSMLGLVFAIRICAFSLGENDIQDLRKVSDRFPQKTFAFIDIGGNIWHEVGLLSVTTGRPALRLTQPTEVRQALQNGAILVVNTDQEDLLSLEGLPKKGGSDWWRLQRNFKVPSLKDLREVGERKNRRKVKLIWLE